MSIPLFRFHKCLLLIGGIAGAMGGSVISNSQAHAAGPVERRLMELGEKVPIPKMRPKNAIQVADPSIAEAEEQEGEPAAEIQAPISPPPIKPPVESAAETPPLKGDAEVENQTLSEPTCVENLRLLAKFEVSDQPIDGDDACRIESPVILQSTKGRDAVQFNDGLLLSCDFATRLSHFASNTVQPLAQYHLGARLTKLNTGKGYVCRRRNNAKDGKLSEHSFGKAVDIVSFEFDGRDSVPVRDTATMVQSSANFSTAVRTAACGTFTTVLGPGSNPAHATHLHFDTGRMGEKKNPYRICE